MLPNRSGQKSDLSLHFFTILSNNNFNKYTIIVFLIDNFDFICYTFIKKKEEKRCLL